jgi:hypothetical protein
MDANGIPAGKDSATSRGIENLAVLVCKGDFSEDQIKAAIANFAKTKRKDEKYKSWTCQGLARNITQFLPKTSAVKSTASQDPMGRAMEVYGTKAIADLEWMATNAEKTDAAAAETLREVIRRKNRDTKV